MNKPINTQTHKREFMCYFVRLCFSSFMLLCYRCFSLPFFAILCLIKERQSTRARYESLTRVLIIADQR